MISGDAFNKCWDLKERYRAELTDARAALAKAELENVATKEHAVELWRRQVAEWQVEHDQLLAQLATARAVAMEECARLVCPSLDVCTDPLCDGHRIREAALLPSTLVAVDKKKLETLRALARGLYPGIQDQPSVENMLFLLDAALGAGK